MTVESAMKPWRQELLERSEARDKAAARLEGKTVPQLRKAAKRKGLTGFSKMKKDELVEALAEP